MPNPNFTEINRPHSHFAVQEAARYVGMSASFLNKARLSGRGPRYLKLGARVVYEQDELDTWLNSRRRTSTSQAPAQGVHP